MLRARENIIYNAADYQRITHARQPIHSDPALTTMHDKPQRATKPVGKKNRIAKRII
jgi:hypothetical protein